jgi:chromosome segregation ATPase
MTVETALDSLHHLSQGAEDKEAVEAKKQDANFKLEFYKKHGVEAKMKRQTEFDSELREKLDYESQENKQLFEEILGIYSKLLTSFEQIKQAHTNGHEILGELKTKISEFDQTKESQKEEFAQIERTLTEELKQEGAVAISPDESLTLTTAVTEADESLAEIGIKAKKQDQLEDERHQALVDLKELWREEFRIIQSELEKVNQIHKALQIESEFKEDKSTYLEAMISFFKGSKIRRTTFESLVQEYSDFGTMRKSLPDVLVKLGTTAQTFEEFFAQHYKKMLVWQVPNLFRIKYRGKELRYHSLGQRASALILFVLSQRENDVIIIDQPEDDLDNQTIMESK